MLFQGRGPLGHALAIFQSAAGFSSRQSMFENIGRYDRLVTARPEPASERGAQRCADARHVDFDRSPRFVAKGA